MERCKKASRFVINTPMDVMDKEKWLQGCEWLYDKCLKIKKAVILITNKQ